MTIVKRIVCLANSRKGGERCVAGVEILNGVSRGWVRPVSNHAHQEISWAERRYRSGGDPELLDIVDIPMLKHSPKGYQRENWLLDSGGQWEKSGVFEWSDLYKLVETNDTLWPNGYHKNNDRIPDREANKEIDSLRLIHVDGLRLRWERGERRWGIRGYFNFAEKDYSLSVTDPHIEQRYGAQKNQVHRLGGCFLTISLGEPFYGYCYKLIAAVMEKPR